MDKSSGQQASSSSGNINRANRTVRSQALRRTQHIHAAFFATLGISGFALAGVRAWVFGPPSAWAYLIFSMSFLLIGLGVTAGFHRHFTHKSFEAPKAVRIVLAILGCMAGQGPVVFWVALHRMHHECADRPGDPHSPHMYADGSPVHGWSGLFHAYIGWTFAHDVPNANHYAKDLLRDADVMQVNRKYYLWVLLGLALPSLAGFALIGGWSGAFDGLIFGGMIRMFAVHNIIWLITSFSHVYGRHDFHSRDCSRNSLALALPTLGEGWHNNHHAFPHVANLAFKWWQLDITGIVIDVLAKLGLASNVQRVTAQQRRAKSVNNISN